MFSNKRKSGVLGSGWACIHMPWWLRMLNVGLVVLLINGCAAVKIYDDKGSNEDIGIEFYTAKPYLIVEKKAIGGSVIEIAAKIVYLPDMAKPKYAKLKPGLGSGKLNLTFSNSILTSVGLEADSKIPETIQSIGGLIKADESERKKPELKEITELAPGIYEIVIDKKKTELRRVKLSQEK